MASKLAEWRKLSQQRNKGGATGALAALQCTRPAQGHVVSRKEAAARGVAGLVFDIIVLSTCFSCKRRCSDKGHQSSAVLNRYASPASVFHLQHGGDKGHHCLYKTRTNKNKCRKFCQRQVSVSMMSMMSRLLPGTNCTPASSSTDKCQTQSFNEQ